jgi:hypothetical protein
MVEQSAEKIKRSDELVEDIGKVMPYIDARLERSEVSLTERVLVAATIFVYEMVFEVRNGDTIAEKADTTDYVARPWFAIIYHHVEHWYREHYGEALNVNEGGAAHGYVLFGPFLLN